MNNINNTSESKQNVNLKKEISTTLDETVQTGIEQIVFKVLEEEVEIYLGRGKYQRTDECSFRGYRNGYQQERIFMINGYNLKLTIPRVSDIPEGQESFQSDVIEHYKRRSPRLNETMKELYLEGLSTRDFSGVMKYLCNGGKISASTINKLIGEYNKDYEKFMSRDLSKEKYYYIWADGIYQKAGPDREKLTLLVIVGANENGNKRLLGVMEGYRESIESWKDILRDLRDRGLNAPALAVADGNSGFWGALGEIYPNTQQQRCWKHKKANVIDKIPKSKQRGYKNRLNDIYNSRSKKESMRIYKELLEELKASGYTRAYDCLKNDRDQLFTYFNFPQEHWMHLKTNNPLESIFSNVRIRTRALRRFQTTRNAKIIIYKTLEKSQERWRRINSYDKLIEVSLPGEDKKIIDEEVNVA